jgi:hypothetical protein
MATPIENARKRLAEIEAEAERIRQFLAMYERFSNENRLGSGALQATNPKENYPQDLSAVNIGGNSRRGGRKGPLPRELVAMMERLIREVARPMTRGEIVEALNRREVEIPAKDQQRYIGTLAWRHKGTFVNIEGRGYWLRREPVPAPPAPSEADGQEALFPN